MLDGLKVVRWSFPFTKKSRGRQEFLPKRIARPIWRNRQDDNTSQNAQRPSRSFAGKNCTFSLCSSCAYVFVTSTHGRDILLDPKPVFKITKVFLRSQDLKEQEFNNFTERNHFLFQEEWLAASPRGASFLISQPDELLKAHDERTLVSPVHCCSRCFTHTNERFS